MASSSLLFQQYRERRNSDCVYALLLNNCRTLEVETGAASDELQTVACVNKTIFSIVTRANKAMLYSVLKRHFKDVKCSNYCIEEIECGGRILIPGLCDAHVHATAFTADLPGMLSVPESLTALRAERILEGMLLRGFTTIRDCGGADFGLAEAVEEGTILGPRILFTGHALSQTGGHGDMRGRGEDCFACGAALRGIGRVADGEAAVRLAARDELRQGAHCIKVMASGGVSSPTDRLTNTQFSLGELTAIVEEARAAVTYVCAHAYTAQAITRAVQCGVRSIEHGNYLDTETAQLMADNGVFLVATVVTYAALAESGEAAGMKPELVAKVGDLCQAGLQAVGTALKAGVTVCYGSDLLGELHSQQLKEFELCSSVMTPLQLLQSATINTAKLFNMEDKIGKIEQGYYADLILLDTADSPLDNPSVLYDASNFCMIVKEGYAVKSKTGQLGSLPPGI